ncbi:MFS general substrate transporter [Suhomyces tanzawaensis NRRL Y-17324]|uniref:MFS general substrate transporter n=1 Tax=Suhomyces tanzawaensis NRRL Y-17324 TaxID=984487 RepID=A0A1E4SEM0_9ASCO|nr:MFS general substrate transporter [Suhomyces tanzawaensis NRRL Y-17324]ODV77957.1 MFS general substrate transporter [Suhomyces tanzawaensis NRRL Y-17324]
MVHTFIRDSFWGRIIYHISKSKYFNHKEERNDYVLPEKYLARWRENHDLVDSLEMYSSNISDKTPLPTNKIYVDWDGPDDPENPYNWPLFQKTIFILEIAFLTTSVYMGSAIYTPGIQELMEEYEISQTLAMLPLTMFVIGYGIAPMVLSPMSENAYFGRTSIYVITLFIFFILQIPTALAKNIASLSVLRFLGGVFASPALATGGASICDVLSVPYAPLGLAAWGIGAVCGPSIGPLIGSVLTVKGGWRWTFWFMAILSGCTFLVLSWFLPETFADTLLLRRAKRLRKVTGNLNYTTEPEQKNKNRNFNELAIETLWRPIEISIVEPVVFLINMYIAMVYSIIYLWFEAFPIVFLGTYNFTLVELGVSFCTIIVGVLLAFFFYLIYMDKKFTVKILAGENVPPEQVIPLAIFGGAIIPIGLFIFGWTATEDLHWIGPIMGAGVFTFGAFFIFQSLFNYLGASFRRYLASVYAGNDLFRSCIAGVFPLFGHALFNNLRTDRFPVGWGSSVLGFITVAMVLIPVLFYMNGPKLRARSKYAN